MTQITIEKNAADAIAWAIVNIGSERFNVVSAFPQEKWTFQFRNKKDATTFALKWI